MRDAQQRITGNWSGKKFVMQKKSRMIPPGSRSASHHEEVDYQKKGECREGSLKVALEQLPCAESHQEEYENE